MTDAALDYSQVNTSTPPLAHITLSSAHRHASVVLPPLVVLVLLTLTSNALVIFCCRRHPRLRGITWWYVSSLAVVDFSVGLFAMVGMTMFTLYGYWPLSPVLCTIWVTFDASYCSVSIFHLCLIAWDRYQALIHPTVYRAGRRSFTTAVIKIICAWTLGILIWVPVVLWVRLRATQREVSATHCLFLPSKTFTCVQTVLVFALPISALVYMYISCLIVLRKRFINMRQNPSSTSYTVKEIPEKYPICVENANCNHTSTTLCAEGEVRRCNTLSDIPRPHRCQDTNPTTKTHDDQTHMRDTSLTFSNIVLHPSEPINNGTIIENGHANNTTNHGSSSNNQRNLLQHKGQSSCDAESAQPMLNIEQTSATLTFKFNKKALSTSNLSNCASNELHANNFRSRLSLSTLSSKTTSGGFPPSSSYQYQQTLRSIRTLGLLLIAFLFCWLPFCFMWPVQALCSSCVPLQLYEYSYWMAYVNSLLNPFLYVLSNKDFRDALKCQNTLHI